ncbi:YtxH domain-containing protein [Pseudactinotalea sp. Z1748]|uniref:YtxH domain-containing protein n=1 Tax=Pseudactinotalea sp. Z1748 TaxID=3413027 RepID=UPI003C7A194E
MKGKVLFVLGAAVGYLLGSRAGQEHYEKVKEQAKSVWENPSVQEKVNAAESRIGTVVREQGSHVAEKISGTVKNKFGSDSSDSVGSEDVQAPAEPYPPAPRPHD